MGQKDEQEGLNVSRIWKETLSPTYLHDTYGVYQGIWMSQMDRCWISDDGIQVTSRLLETKWGKVEHAAVTVIAACSTLPHLVSSNLLVT